MAFYHNAREYQHWVIDINVGTSCSLFSVQSNFNSFPSLPLLVAGTERNRRSGRQHSVSTRRMVALYDYDPRESSPNVDVEVLTAHGSAQGAASLPELVCSNVAENYKHWSSVSGQMAVTSSWFLSK